ncbi:hypothetical protein ONA70_12610 [Micromonospora yasonensis]|uniref:hypothetical protein n=1 Tax=Micromonospora yasonensis TaxID=1128667 RepID=UPI002230ABBA|nr:hypothetical protein [Micromonospora yasonensis]MCW3840940.1 hypothetical protein [Micromonospora yasonensis]
MPAPVAPAEKRTPLLTVLFWIGVALAPLAALILLVADGGALRFGAVLAILAVVLIGLSVALRSDGGGTAGADELRDELAQLSRELRGEIAAAAQRGNQALDQVQRTQESVTALRRRLDAAAAAAAGLAAPPPEEPVGARARVSAPEPYDDRREQPEGGSSWGQPSGDRRGEEESARRPQPGTRYGAERPARSSGADRPPAGVYGVPRTPEPDDRPEPGPRQVGVVHRTETVHVTTRHTIVDGGDPGASGRYGGYAGRWSADERGHGGTEPEERPRPGYREAGDDRDWSGVDRGWSEQAAGRDDRSWGGQGGSRTEWGRAAPQDGDLSPDASGASARDHSWADAGRAAGTSGDDRGWSAGPGEQRSWSSGGSTDERSRAGEGDDRPWSRGRDEPDRPGQGDGWKAAYAQAWTPAESSGTAAEPDDGDYWSELRSGNRWASVRDDEHGREIRVGERRAAVHADGGGAEYRVEDRWASVREPRRDQGGTYGAVADEPRRGQGGRYATAGEAGWAEESRPALPAGGVPVPDEWRPSTQRSGQPEWRQVDPEPVRYADERYGYPPRDDAPRAGGTRSDRWR